ncbi:unnamed protein product [Trichobilharzia regenti]|nr:unnamed protein product [Trichobilharzia regenti]
MASALCFESKTTSLATLSKQTSIESFFIDVHFIPAENYFSTHTCFFIFYYSDYDSLSPDNPSQNCRLAFDVASKLGVPRMLDPSEVVSKTRPPDLLSMMTYLHQIRTLCCDEQTTKNNSASTCSNNDGSLFSGVIEHCFAKVTKPTAVVIEEKKKNTTE